MRALRPVLPGAVLDVVGGPNRPPLEGSASARLFERVCAVAVGLGLATPASASVGGASDGNLTAGVGTATLDGMGAVGGGAHSDGEHVLAAQLVPRTALLAAVVADLLADPLPATNGQPADRPGRP
jgi:glutamate carboxypeptidase